MYKFTWGTAGSDCAGTPNSQSMPIYPTPNSPAEARIVCWVQGSGRGPAGTEVHPLKAESKTASDQSLGIWWLERAPAFPKPSVLRVAYNPKPTVFIRVTLSILS